MVTAYQIDPKTGLVMVFITPQEVELTLTMIMRGLHPGDLRDSETKRVLKGWELVYENTFPERKIVDRK